MPKYNNGMYPTSEWAVVIAKIRPDSAGPRFGTNLPNMRPIFAVVTNT